MSVARVVLVGLPGVGKTTVGRALAQVLDTAFVDTDDLFARREGVSVPDFLRDHGEVEFRRHEIDALEAALVGGAVVATGGGVVSTPAARELLGSQLTVWLDASDETIVTRTHGGDRPLLGGDPGASLAGLRERREDLYREVSRLRLDASRPVAEVVGDVVAWLAVAS